MKWVGHRFAALVAVVLLSTLTAQPVAAAETTTVWQINVTIPLIDKAGLGVLTTTIDNATGQGTWSFQGTIGGQLARASGAGTFSGTGSTATATMTAIDTWQMPGIAPPALPATATIRVVGNIAYVSNRGVTRVVVAAPVAVSPPLTFPVQPGVYTATMPGAGEQSVQHLPNTGVGLVDSSEQANAAVPATLRGLVAVCGGITLMLAIGRWRQRRRSAAV